MTDSATALRTKNRSVDVAARIVQMTRVIVFESFIFL